MKNQSDFLVIGSGIAGLTFALKAAEFGTVIILTKKTESQSNTFYAQGGIAAVIDPRDSFESHIEDTLKAGAGICSREAVELLVKEGPQAISDLLGWETNFTRKADGGFSLGREGGHSYNRIVHAADITGREIQRALWEKARNHPNIRTIENQMVLELITEHHLLTHSRRKETNCYGVYSLDAETKKVEIFLSGYTILTTGGVGQVYLHTTNPSIATGDGIAMAYRAGAAVANLEFMQFHPTSLFHPQGNSFLISEAVRGFGGILRNRKGEAFMTKYHDMKDLAPRDVVARAIDTEMKRLGEECVFLDVTHKEPDQIRNRFPNIYQRCLELKIDMAKEWVPVVPAAHYMCGGVKTDLWGRTTINRLYAAGEVTHTGVHGANRLASNSLLEAVVFAKRIAEDLKNRRSERLTKSWDVPAWDDSGTMDQEEWVYLSHDRKQIRSIMWDYVGIVRSNLRLARASRRIQLLCDEIEDFYKKTVVTPELLELRNLAHVARLIVRSAQIRKESRGLHFNRDYPERDDKNWAIDTVLEHDFTSARSIPGL